MADQKEPELQEQDPELDDGIYTLTDEEGKEYAFEMAGMAEIDGVNYYAMVPVEPDKNEDEAYEYVILKSQLDEATGEEMLVTVDDDDEFDKAADYFDDYFSEEIDYDHN